MTCLKKKISKVEWESQPCSSIIHGQALLRLQHSDNNTAIHVRLIVMSWIDYNNIVACY